MVCLPRGPRLPWWAGAPGASPSVIQDDLDKTGHVCVFGVVHGEKRMLLHRKEEKTHVVYFTCRSLSGSIVDKSENQSSLIIMAVI